MDADRSRRLLFALTICFGLATLHLAGDIAWFRLDRGIPAADDAHHRRLALEYERLLLETAGAPGLLDRITACEVAYPPLSHLVAAACHSLLPSGRDWIGLAGCFWLALLLLGAYGLAERLGGRGSGPAAAVLLASFPIVYIQTRYSMLELPVAALAALATLLLVRSGGLQRSAEAAGFGIVAGLGMLTKFTFPIFVASPLAMAAWTAVRARGHRRTRTLRFAGNLALAGLVALAISSWWYSSRWEERGRWLERSGSLDEQSYPTSWRDPLGVSYYAMAVASYPGLLPYLAAAAAGAWAMARRRHPALRQLLAAIAVPWVALTLIRIKWGDYFLAALWPLALLATIGFERVFRANDVDESLSSAPGKSAALLGVSALGVVLWWQTGFGIDLKLPQDRQPSAMASTVLLGPMRLLKARVLDVGEHSDSGFYKEDWWGFTGTPYPLDAILDAVASCPDGALIGLQSDIMLFADRETFAWAGFRADLTQRFIGLEETPAYRPEELQGLVLHHAGPELPPVASFAELAQAAPEIPSPLPASLARVPFYRLALIPSHSCTIHVYRRNEPQGLLPAPPGHVR